MVEFGLKLQDNKVREWSDKYIDYEKLKRLLQIAKERKRHEIHWRKKISIPKIPLGPTTKMRKER